MTKIVPRKTDAKVNTSIWQKHYLDMLQEVKSKGSVQSKYKFNAPCRVYGVLGTTTISLTCCLPCLIWDASCACFSMCVDKNPFRFGCAIEFIDDSCTNTFQDTRETDLKAIGKVIDPGVFTDVCIAYMDAFDACLSEKKAREANIIRGLLVNIIKSYSPRFQDIFIKDDGNLDKLRGIIQDYKKSYKTSPIATSS